MAESLSCWRCGHSLEDLSLPLSRRDQCPECAIDLHVCRMCTQFDSEVPRACREDDAEEIKEKERANFCDYFAPSHSAFDSGMAVADAAARQQLDGLFGDGAADDAGDVVKDDAKDDAKDEAQQAADDLFK